MMCVAICYRLMAHSGNAVPKLSRDKTGLRQSAALFQLLNLPSPSAPLPLFLLPSPLPSFALFSLPAALYNQLGGLYYLGIWAIWSAVQRVKKKLNFTQRH